MTFNLRFINLKILDWKKELKNNKEEIMSSKS